jgi:hypothetical protein
MRQYGQLLKQSVDVLNALISEYESKAQKEGLNEDDKEAFEALLEVLKAKRRSLRNPLKAKRKT